MYLYTHNICSLQCHIVTTTLLLKEGIRKVLENELPSSKDELPLKAKPSIDFPEFHINASVEACFFLPFLTFMAERM